MQRLLLHWCRRQNHKGTRDIAMEQLLGPLEQKIMAALWQLGQGTVRDVLNHLPGSKRPAYTTLMTVMVRLHGKRLLHRTPKGNAYVYEPTYSEEGFIEEASRKAVRDVLERFGDVAVAHFVEEGHLSLEQLRQLREMAAEEEGEE